VLTNISSIFIGFSLRMICCIILSTRTAVFPEPAAAATSKCLPDVSIASCCSYLQVIILYFLLFNVFLAFYLLLHRLSLPSNDGNHSLLMFDQIDKRISNHKMYKLYVVYIHKGQALFVPMSYSNLHLLTTVLNNPRAIGMWPN